MPKQNCAVSSVNVSGLCTTGCAVKQRESGLLCVQSAGQQLLPNLVTNTEERARRIAEKPSDEASVSTILSIDTKLGLHPLTQLASSTQFEMDLRLEQSNLFFCVIALSRRYP